MKQPEVRRKEFAERSIPPNLSVKNELNDIIQLAAIICKTPFVLVTLLDEEKLHVEFKAGADMPLDPVDVDNTFCKHTIAQNDVFEVPNMLRDMRFISNPFVTGSPHVRFYAGAPLRAQSGENIGCLCVIDTKPNCLNDEQKKMLKILSRQIINVLELEQSLESLKDQISRVQDSEIKLKSIFQSSPNCHILVDKNLLIKAFNNAAATWFKKLLNQTLEEGKPIISFMRTAFQSLFVQNFNIAVQGQPVCFLKEIKYPCNAVYWWEMEFNPVHNHAGEIIGVSFDATDNNERMKHQQQILLQNTALKQIAQIQSHEFRKPVANILGIVKLLKDKDEKETDELLNDLEHETLDLDNKIKHIVKLTA